MVSAQEWLSEKFPNELEREKNKSKFLSEQLEEVLRGNEQALEAKVETNPNFQQK